jgi:hypothetical protein
VNAFVGPGDRAVSVRLEFEGKGLRFVLLHSLPLMPGFVPPTIPGEPRSHRFSDLQRNDVIEAVYFQWDDRMVCSQILICRRPGGKIPPIAEDLGDGFRSPSSDPWHERMQAYQDWEEKGIPIPDKYCPPGELSRPFPDIAPRPREHRPAKP